MGTAESKKETERIEFRVSKEEKELFEHARSLKGFITFSDFARRAIKKEAIAILETEKSLLVSKLDKELFFKALMGIEEAPNSALLEAIQFHDKMISK